MTPTVPRLRQFFSTPRLRTRSATAVTIAAVSVFAAPLACTHTIEITTPPVDGPSGTPAGGLAPSPDAAPPADAPTPPGLDDDAASTLDWNGEWEWLTPDTSGHTFRAAWAAAPDDLWLVGDHGVVVRWDGQSRARVVYQGPNDVSLKAIAGRGPNDVWVAGTNHVAHWDGERWSFQSHWLGRLDIRTLVAEGDTSLLALTEDGRLFEKSANLGNYPLGEVYDVTPAARGGVYALRAEGVEWLRYSADNRGFPTREVVVPFDAPLDKNVWKHGRLFGDTPESFRYLFEYDASPTSSGTYFILSEVPPPSMASKRVSTMYFQRPFAGDRGRGNFVQRIDREHAFIQFGPNPPLVYDGRAMRGLAKDERVRAGFRTASGAIGFLGVGGLVATTRQRPEDGAFEVIPLHRGGAGSKPRVLNTHFAVAADDSAWAAALLDPGDPNTSAFASWDEEKGYVWRATPAGTRVQGLLPVAANDAWLLLRGVSSSKPKPDLVAHWDGQRFDAITPCEHNCRLRMTAPEPRGTFFGISHDGELLHADAKGQLVSVGRAADHAAGAGCQGGDVHYGWEVAPIGERRAFIVGPRCSVSFFDGSNIRPLPLFELNRPRQNAGPIHLWARDERSLYLLHAFNGLYRWDGQRWTTLYRTTEQIIGLWGADDTHVWFVEKPSSSYVNFDFDVRTDPGWRLKMWDGKAVRDVGTTPGASFLAGGSTTAWLLGSGTGGGTATLRLRATPRSPRPR